MNRDPHSEERLSAYLDGELPDDQRREVEAHLASCPSCSRMLDDLRTLSRDIREEGVPEVPAGLEARVRGAVRNEPRAGTVVPFPGRWTIPATVAATLGAAALLVVAYRFLPVRTTPPPQQPSASSIEIPSREAEPERDEAAPVPEKKTGNESVNRRDASPAPPPPSSASGYAAERDEAPREREAASLAPASALGRQAFADKAAAPCPGAFLPYERPLLHVGTAPEETIRSADEFVRSFGGSIVIRATAPYARRYDVRAEDWPSLREYLLREGFATDEEPEAVPPETDCVGVRVDASPGTP